MAGLDPNTNLSPVVSPPAQAPQGAAPAYIAPQPQGAWPLTRAIVGGEGRNADANFARGDYLPGAANVLRGAAMVPITAAADMFNQGGEGAAQLVRGIGTLVGGGVARPDAPLPPAAPTPGAQSPTARPTDNAIGVPSGFANPQPVIPKSLAQHMSETTGVPTHTHITGETHPGTDTVSDFVSKNRHMPPLSPTQLQALAPYLPPVLSPQDHARDTYVKSRMEQLGKTVNGYNDQNDPTGAQRQAALNATYSDPLMQAIMLANPYQSMTLPGLVGGKGAVDPTQVR